MDLQLDVIRRVVMPVVMIALALFTSRPALNAQSEHAYLHCVDLCGNNCAIDCQNDGGCDAYVSYGCGSNGKCCCNNYCVS